MYCKNCGTELRIDDKFCAKCGQGMDIPIPPAKVFLPASIGQRLANFILDRIIIDILAIILILIAVIVGVISKNTSDLSGILFLIFAIIVLFGYRIFFETMWQRTPGKWASKTKVVCRDGSKPKFWRVVGRTIARLIPFEPFSFLFSAHPIGWHDSLSKTLVVPSEYTEDDVKNINFAEAKKSGNSTATIIILAIVGFLVVIAIIGVMASVMLAATNAARNKGVDAAVKANIINMQMQATLYYDQYGNYTKLCSDPTISEMMNAIENNPGAIIATCASNADGYAVSAPLKSGKYFCADSSGTPASYRDKDLAPGTTCPPVSLDQTDSQINDNQNLN